MGSCRVGFRPGLCRSSATARRRASRTWQDVLAARTSHWARCQGAMVGRSRAGRGGRARGAGTAERCVGGGVGRSSPGMVFMRLGWRVALAVGAYWLLAPNGCSTRGEVNYLDRAATRRTAGPRDLACGPEAFPFLGRSTGETRGAAYGPSPLSPRLCTRRRATGMMGLSTAGSLSSSACVPL